MTTLAQVILKDILANRPGAAIPGRMFYATDVSKQYRDNGTSWDDVTTGFQNPMTTEGDLIVAGPGGAAIRLAAGTAGQVLTTEGNAAEPVWSDPSAVKIQNVPVVSTAPLNGQNLTYDGTNWVPTTPQVVPVATTAQAGTVKPDGTTVDVDGTGTISVPTATTLLKGLVKPDGTTVAVDGTGKISVATAAPTTLGVVKPDGSSITVDGSGILSVVFPLTLVFAISSGGAGTSVIPYDILAPRSGKINRCVVSVRSSDAGVPLTFRIKRNGVDIFSTDPTLAAGAPAGMTIFTNLTSTPLNVGQHDVFTMDILTGSSNWALTAILES